MAVIGVILAGGLSRRMGGGDKSLKKIGNQTLLEMVIERIKPQVDAVVLNSNNNPNQYNDFDIPIIPDVISGHLGPLAGVLSGMRWAQKNGYGHIVTIAADTPFFPKTLVSELLLVHHRTNADIVLAATRKLEGGTHTHPTFGLWSSKLADNLSRSLQDGVRKIVFWTNQQKSSQAVFSGFKRDPFFNINTPDDLELAKQLAAKNP